MSNTKKTALILRTSNSDRSSRNGFVWPESGPVECPDWNPEPVCGGGLHGALWGEGDGSLFNWDANAVWQVVEVAEDDIVDLDGKVKFPRGTVVYSGDRETATKMIQEARPGAAVIGGTATAKNDGTATAGNHGTATAGNHGTATAGNHGTATAGYYGTATAGHGGTATAGTGGEIRIRWYDGKRHRLAVGYVGEDGIEPDVSYKVEDGKLVKA